MGPTFSSTARCSVSLDAGVVSTATSTSTRFATNASWARGKADLLDARAEGERSFVAGNVLTSAAAMERAAID